jgi:crotonobetainyl-CoA:carnitine CoA-transferase CaiB-like acyl-CoA transferase
MSAPGVAPVLSGVRVLDLTRLLPGPVCTMHLADLGADVIKVEDPESGDYARDMDAPAGGDSPFFSMVNRNKRSIALDLKRAPARDAFMRLVATADALIEGFRPGVATRLGIGYDSISAINPRIVYCALSGYGQTGPYRDRAGHDINYLGYAGVLDQTGVGGGPPALCNLQIADLLGGALSAATAMLAAMVGARVSGRGRYIDLAMADSTLSHNIFALHALAARGATAPRGMDLLSGGVPCYGVYRTSDRRWMAVGALEQKFWERLCEALERPDLKPFHLARGEEGLATRNVLEAIFARETRAHWTQMFARIDCCVTPVLTLEEALVDEQFISRGMVRGAAGKLQFASPFGLTPPSQAPVTPAPALGQHTREILLEAGYSEAEISAL